MVGRGLRGGAQKEEGGAWAGALALALHGLEHGLKRGSAPPRPLGFSRVALSLRAEAAFDPSDTCLGRSLVTYLLESLFSGALSVAGTVLGSGGARAAVGNRAHSR